MITLFYTMFHLHKHIHGTRLYYYYKIVSHSNEAQLLREQLAKMKFKLDAWIWNTNVRRTHEP